MCGAAGRERLGCKFAGVLWLVTATREPMIPPPSILTHSANDAGVPLIVPPPDVVVPMENPAGATQPPNVTVPSTAICPPSNDTVPGTVNVRPNGMVSVPLWMWIDGFTVPLGNIRSETRLVEDVVTSTPNKL